MNTLAGKVYNDTQSFIMLIHCFTRDGKDKPLADVYLEGSDQHRGWFQSSLLTSSK